MADVMEQAAAPSFCDRHDPQISEGEVGKIRGLMVLRIFFFRPPLSFCGQRLFLSAKTKENKRGFCRVSLAPRREQVIKVVTKTGYGMHLVGYFL